MKLRLLFGQFDYDLLPLDAVRLFASKSQNPIAVCAEASIQRAYADSLASALRVSTYDCDILSLVDNSGEAKSWSPVFAFKPGDRVGRFFDEWAEENAKPNRWRNPIESYNSVISRAGARYLRVHEFSP